MSPLAAALALAFLPQSTSLEQAGRTMFTALAANDFRPVQEALPPVDTFAAMLEASFEDLDPDERATARRAIEDAGGAPGVRARALAGLERGFQRAREDASERFDWDDATFVATLPPPAGSSSFQTPDFRTAPVQFIVLADGTLWVFGAQDVLEGPDGWAFIETIGFDGARVPETSDRPDHDEMAFEVEKLRARVEAQVFELEEREALHAHEVARLTARLEDARRELNHVALAADERVEEVLSKAMERETALRAEVERLDVTLAKAYSELEAALDREQAAVDEVRSVREEFHPRALRLELENAGLRLALDRVSGAPVSGTPVDAARLPLWAAAGPGSDESASAAAVRAALARPVDLDIASVRRVDLLELFALASGANVVVFGEDPNLYAEVDIHVDRATLAEAIEQAFGTASVRLHGGAIVVGDAVRGLGLLTVDVAEDGAATWAALRQQRFVPTIEDAFGTDLLEFLESISGVDVLSTRAALRDFDDTLHTVRAPREISIADLIELMLADVEIDVQVGPGYVLFAERGSERTSRIPDDARARIDSSSVAVDLDVQSLAERVEALAALLGVDLTLKEDVLEDYSEDALAPLRAQRAPASLLLELVAQHVEGRWVRDGNGFRLEFR